MGKTAVIFPGQGAQYVGMAKDFYDSFEDSKAVIDTADSVLDIDLKKICFEENEDINKTEYTQPAMVAAELAIYEHVKNAGLKADVFAGLSLGEYSALTACGAMKLPDAIRTVRQRGILMQNEVPLGQGAMAAVIASEALDKACEALQAAGAKRVIKLNVSGPFHSKMLEPAGEKLYAYLRDVEIADDFLPYVCNADACYVTDASEVKTLLMRQVYSSVRWQQSIEAMIADGVDTFVEVGPGKTLSGFMRKINKEMKCINIATVDDLKKLEELNA